MPFRLTLIFAALLTLMSALPLRAQDQAWIQIEAHPTLAEANDRARAWSTLFGDVGGFRLRNGWYVLALGPQTAEQAAQRMLQLRRDGAIPDDSYIADGATYGDRFWPVGADAVAVPDVTAPEPEAEPEAGAEVAPAEPVVPVEPEETLKQARAAEAALSRDDKKALQTALAWYGFYAAAVDGDFGPGTRNSMSAWQVAKGYEPTGVLSTKQRAELTQTYAADQAEFGFETITEPEAGIEITLPLALVKFDHYEPPFVHYADVTGAGIRLILISQPGDRASLDGLYDILQTLQIVPPTGEREKGERSFTINARSSTVESFAFAEAGKGHVKGFLLSWPPSQADRIARILPALKASFRAVGDKALDPGLIPLDDASRRGLLSGLEVRKPRLSRSGFFVDATGNVATTTEAVDACARITIERDIEARVLSADAATGLALLAPASPLSPPAVAGLATSSPRIGSEISVAGYSFGDKLPAPVLTTGLLEDVTGLLGETGVLRLTAPALPGDVGGPVLDGTGAVLGMLLPNAATGGKTLPEGVAFAADAAVLSAALTAAGLTATPPPGPVAPDARARAALGMTVLVSCWD